MKFAYPKLETERKGGKALPYFLCLFAVLIFMPFCLEKVSHSADFESAQAEIETGTGTKNAAVKSAKSETEAETETETKTETTNPDLEDLVSEIPFSTPDSENPLEQKEDSERAAALQTGRKLVKFQISPQTELMLPMEFHPWGAFEPGAWNFSRTIVESRRRGRMASKTFMETSTILHEKTDECYSTVAESFLILAGKNIQKEPKTIKTDFFGLSPDEKHRMQELEPEILEIEGQPIQCRVLMIFSEGKTLDRKMQIWFNETTSPYVFQRKKETFPKGSKNCCEKIFQKMTSINVQLSVKGEILNGYQYSQSAIYPTYAAESEIVASLAIPGRIIRQITSEKDLRGNPLQDISTELLDYGLSEENRQRDIYRSTVRSRRLVISPQETLKKSGEPFNHFRIELKNLLSESAGNQTPIKVQTIEKPVENSDKITDAGSETGAEVGSEAGPNAETAAQLSTESERVPEEGPSQTAAVDSKDSLPAEPAETLPQTNEYPNQDETLDETESLAGPIQADVQTHKVESETNPEDAKVSVDVNAGNSRISASAEKKENSEGVRVYSVEFSLESANAESDAEEVQVGRKGGLSLSLPLPKFFSDLRKKARERLGRNEDERQEGPDEEFSEKKERNERRPHRRENLKSEEESPAETSEKEDSENPFKVVEEPLDLEEMLDESILEPEETEIQEEETPTTEKELEQTGTGESSKQTSGEKDSNQTERLNALEKKKVSTLRQKQENPARHSSENVEKVSRRSFEKAAESQIESQVKPAFQEKPSAPEQRLAAFSKDVLYVSQDTSPSFVLESQLPQDSQSPKHAEYLPSCTDKEPLNELSMDSSLSLFCSQWQKGKCLLGTSAASLEIHFPHLNLVFWQKMLPLPLEKVSETHRSRLAKTPNIPSTEAPANVPELETKNELPQTSAELSGQKPENAKPSSTPASENPCLNLLSVGMLQEKFAEEFEKHREKVDWRSERILRRGFRLLLQGTDEQQ